MATQRTNKPTLWVGIIPDIFGYGINALGRTKAETEAALRKAYAQHKKAQPDALTDFETSFQYWGGCVFKVKVGKAYFDGFRS
jgi:hypothetical protein